MLFLLLLHFVPYIPRRSFTDVPEPRRKRPRLLSRKAREAIVQSDQRLSGIPASREWLEENRHHASELAPAVIVSAVNGPTAAAPGIRHTLSEDPPAVVISMPQLVMSGSSPAQMAQRMRRIQDRVRRFLISSVSLPYSLTSNAVAT